MNVWIDDLQIQLKQGCESLAPHLILMDINMPEIDGLAATRALRAKNFVNFIVALSAGLVNDKKNICEEAG